MVVVVVGEPSLIVVVVLPRLSRGHEHPSWASEARLVWAWAGPLRSPQRSNGVV